MSLLRHTAQNYVLYSLSCLVIITASMTFILSLYRLQRDASLLNRERKRDYVTNKINKSFPTMAIIMSILVCLSSIVTFIAALLNDRTELIIISIVSNIILGIGLIVLGVIKLGFVQNIVDNFPVDIERLLVDFIVHNSKSTGKGKMPNRTLIVCFIRLKKHRRATNFSESRIATIAVRRKTRPGLDSTLKSPNAIARKDIAWSMPIRMNSAVA